jgi:hypothetical protein
MDAPLADDGTPPADQEAEDARATLRLAAAVAAAILIPSLLLVLAILNAGE